MTPWERVLQHFRFPEEINGVPFIPQPLQIESINELAPLANSGHWLDMGVGKTFVSTACALYWHIVAGNQTVVTMPPLLIKQWGKWLKLITRADGRPLTVTSYRGTPAERKAMSLDVDFVLVGIQIFKKEFDRFNRHYLNKPYSVIVDEATFTANIGTDAHEKVMDFCIGHVQMMLTGTPANKPGDVYGLMKFTAPGTYRNLKHFENLHVEERDFYKNPISYRALDVLNANLLINSKRILFEDMYSEVEEPLFVPINYDLEPDHYKLYRRLSDDELLKLPDGGKIDATTANRLTHALGQIIVNFAHFSGDPKARSNALKLVEEKLHELGNGKLVVFAHYKMTVAHITKAFAHVGARAINSEVTSAQKDKNVEAFIEDPKCRLLVIQFISGGKGLDGLQHVCNHALFIEPCQQPRDFHQAVARIKRMGQRKRVWVGMGIADGTLQHRGFNNLLKNDTIVNQVVRNATELRDAIYGK